MIALLQRVSEAVVEVDDEMVGRIDRGLLILLGVRRGDTDAERDWVARKCAHLRIFPDDDGRMDRSVVDIGGEVLVVPQFTLCSDTRKGNRPSFTDAAPPDRARALYEQFVDAISAYLEQPAEAGVFGAAMQVRLVNDGPVTFWVEKNA